MQRIIISICVPDGCKVDVVAEQQGSEPCLLPAPEATQPALEVSEPQKSEPEKSEPNEPAGPTIEDVKTELLAAIDRVGKTKGLAELRNLGVNRVSELLKEQYEQAIAKFQALVG